jgi:hypothetical protein
VPQCYTKAWHDRIAPASPTRTPYVWVFNTNGTGAHRKAPVNLFTETDIYTIVLPDGQRDLRLEYGFQELEDKFTRVRNLKFNRRVWPDTADLAWVIGFAATAQARTAAHRNFHREQWAGIRNRIEDFQAAFEAAPLGRKDAMTRVGLHNQNSGPEMTLDDVRRMEAQPIQKMIGPTLRSVIPVLARMHAAVLCTEDPIGFVTTDTPCIWFDPEAYKLQPILQSPMLGAPTIEVTLPISPRQCLVITHRRDFHGYIDVDQRVVDEINRRQIAHCDESFISHSEATRSIWFEKPTMPYDAWEKVRERKIASGEWPA